MIELKTNSKISEKGAVMIMLPFILVMLLSLVALGVDTGNLHRTKVEAQTAADIAVLSTLGARASEDNLPILNQIYNDASDFDQTTAAEESGGYWFRRFDAKMRAQRIISGFEETGITPIDDLKQGRVRYVDSTTVINNGPQTEKFQSGAWRRLSVDDDTRVMSVLVRPEIRVFTLINHLIHPGYEDFSTIDAVAEAQIAPANIVFIADMSRSSQCPEIGPCECNNPARTQSCRAEADALGVQLKYERIQDAFIKFTQTFDPGRDRIALVMFNNTAWVQMPFETTGAGQPRFGFNRNAPAQAFNNVTHSSDPRLLDPAVADTLIVPDKNTNLSDALLTAISHVAEVGLIAANQPVSYVLLSDGAATAMRFNRNNGNEDLINFDTFWVDESTPGSTNTYFAPGPFVNRNQYLTLPQVRTHPPLAPDFTNDTTYISDPMVQAGAITDCHNTRDIHIELSNPNPDRRAEGIRRCQGDNWNLLLPCPPGLAAVTRCPNNTFGLAGDNSVGTTIEDRYKELYTLAAIQAATFIRQNRGTIYTVGWGNEAPVDPGDPFQNVFDNASLKSVTLANIANDRMKNHRQSHPDYPGTDVVAFRDPNIERPGAYYAAPDADGVRKALSFISRKIKLRLIQ